MRSNFRSTVIYVLIVLCLFLALFPLVYLFSISVKPRILLFDVPPKWFFKPTWDAYRQIFSIGGELRFFINSIIIASIATMMALFIGSLGAFAFAQPFFRFSSKKGLFFLVLVTRMYPPVTTLIPMYFVMKRLGLIDTRMALIILYIAFQIPLVIWVMRGFFAKIPKEIEESALLDGCSPISVFFRIVVPLSTPGLAASGILIFVLNWNEFIFPLVLTSIRAKTAPVAVMSFLQMDADLLWSSLAAMGIVIILPVIVLMLVAGKYLTKGLTMGALKE